jgi:hypothetical protein
MNQHDPQSNDGRDPRFPSGRWTGYFLDARNPGRHGMDLHLVFARGAITGAGSDAVGAFTIYGRYSDDGECRWTKKYEVHEVAYRGFRETRGIWGVWDLTELGRAIRGGFQIWPEGEAGDAIAADVAASQTAPAERVLTGVG